MGYSFCYDEYSLSVEGNHFINGTLSSGSSTKYVLKYYGNYSTRKSLQRFGNLVWSKNDTGNVISFVEVNDVTIGKLFNATNDDIQKDNVLSFPNQTVSTGAEYKAYVLVLKTANTCASGYNSPGLCDTRNYLCWQDTIVVINSRNLS